MIDEIVRMQKEEEIIYNSMFCSYMILTNKIMDLIDYLIDFFVEQEDYEKCQDLVDSKKLYTKKKKKKKKIIKKGA